VGRLPAGPSLVIANEFFDALPIRQFVATDRGWCERLVGLEQDALIFGLRSEPEAGFEGPLRLGDVLERAFAAVDLTKTLAQRLARDSGAALLIDYGYWGPAFGDTLQALKNHAYADPLAEPGEADLTTHVDFHALAQAAQAGNALVHGLATQGDFLETLGIRARAERLKQRATPAQAGDIDSSLARLTERGPKGMGELFQVMALTHAGLADVPGLPHPPSPPARA